MDVFALSATISLNLDNFNTNLDKAQKKFKSFSDNISDLSGKIESVYKVVGDALKPAVDGFNAVEGVGKKAGSAVMTGLKGFAAASTAVAGFGTAAVKSGMAFDATMSEVSAISGATGAEFDSLRDKALEMGAKTKFSASEAGQAMTYMAMAGWKTGDMLGGIEGIMNLAAASGEDLATTSDIVTDALTALGMQASDSGHFADVLAAASANANTNVSMMGETFKYAAPLAGAMGYTAEDTALAIGLMANAGIKGSQSGTALRSIMTRLAKPTKESATAMDALGISITNSDGSMKPLGTTISELREAFSGLSEEQKATYAAMLGGQEAMSGLLAIVNAAPADVEKLTNALNNCNGAAEEMAATMIDNLQGDLTLLGSAFESLQIAISDALTPTLREFAQFGQKAMAQLLEGFQGNGVSGFMSALSGIVTDGVKMLATKAPEFASVSLQFIEALAQGLINASSEVFSSMDEIRGTIVSGLRSFLDKNSNDLVGIGGGILNQIMMGFRSGVRVISDYIGDFVPLIIRAITAYHKEFFTAGMEILGAIGQGIVDNKDLIQENMFQAVFEMVSAIKDNAPAIVEGGLALLEALVGAIEENLPLIIATGTEIVARLIAGISTASPGVQAIIATAILPHILKIVDVVGQIGGAFSSVVNLVTGGSGIGKILSIGGKLMGGITKLFSLIVANPVVAIIGLIIGAVVLLYTKCEWFRDAVHAVIDAVTGFFEGAWEAIKSAWSAAGEFFGGIVDGIKAVFEGIGEFLSGLFTAAWEGMLKGLWEGVTGAFGWVKEQLGGVVDGIIGIFTGADGFDTHSPSRVFATIGENLMRGLEGGAADNVNLVRAQMAATVDVMKGAFSNISTIFTNIGHNAMNALTSSLGGAIDSLSTKVASLMNKITSAAKKALKIKSPSKVWAEIGEFMALGLEQGWDNEYGGVKNAIESGLKFNVAPIGVTASNAAYRGENQTQGGFMGGNSYNFTFNSPEALDPVAASRKAKRAAQMMALGYV